MRATCRRFETARSVALRDAALGVALPAMNCRPIFNSLLRSTSSSFPKSPQENIKLEERSTKRGVPDQETRLVGGHVPRSPKAATSRTHSKTRRHPSNLPWRSSIMMSR